MNSFRRRTSPLARPAGVAVMAAAGVSMVAAALIPVPALAAGPAGPALAGAAAPASVQPPGAPSDLPAPPGGPGCYHLVNGAWVKYGCESAAEVRAHAPHEVEHDDGITATTVNGSMGPFLDFGGVGLYFTSVGTETDSLLGENAFSIQDNANEFIGNNGDTDFVQFFDGSDPGYPDQVCIQEWDVTMYYAHPGTYEPYTSLCAPVSWAVPRGLAAGDGVAVDGYVARDQLWVLAVLPWAAPGYQVVTASAPDLFGLASRWHGVSGGVFGWGYSSTATFSSAEVQTWVNASDCFIYTAAGCPGAETKYLVSGYGATGESNNLIPVLGSPPAHLAQPLSRPSTHSAEIYYVSTTTGLCPLGRPPYCQTN
jgi:hypothetical protein